VWCVADEDEDEDEDGDGDEDGPDHRCLARREGVPVFGPCFGDCSAQDGPEGGGGRAQEAGEET